MFTIDKNEVITSDLIREAIDYNEALRSRYDKLERYYIGKHDILDRTKNFTLKNNKIVVNHAKFITDINTGYLMGNPVQYSTDADIEQITNAYKEQAISVLDNEIAKDLSIFGSQYEYIYNKDTRLVSKDVDNRNCVIVYDDTMEHNKMFAVIYELGDKKDSYNRVTVLTDNLIINYAKDGKLVKGEESVHLFGKVPVIEYINNSERLGDFEVVLPLIDAYNMLQSDRINDKEQLVDAILVLYGFGLTKEQLANLKANRVMTDVPKDSRAEYLVKAINDMDADVLRHVIEDDIHKISMTPNLTDENFVGNSSGVAIRYKLIAFEQAIMNKERYFELGLLERFELYNNYFQRIGKMGKVNIWDIDVVFKHNLPQNDLETSQMVNNLASIVDKKTLLEQLSFVDNAEDVLKAKETEDLKTANLEVGNYGTIEGTVDELEERGIAKVTDKQETLLQKIQNIFNS